jgi:hypothetical protein
MACGRQPIFEEMRIFHGKPKKPPADATNGIGTNVPRAAHTGPERRRPPYEGFSVLRVVPQLVGSGAVTRAETDAVTNTLAAGLRSYDRFCLFDDATYMIVLAHAGDDQGRIVAQRLAVEMTMRSAALRRRKWMVSVAPYPYDERTAAVLADLAAGDADQITA